MSAEIAQTPQAVQTSAAAKLKQHDDAVRANGIKQGRALERAEIMVALGVQTMDELGLIQTVRAEHEAELARVRVQHEREERKHGRGHWWQGALIGGAVTGAVVAAGAAIYTDALIDNVFEASAQVRAQSEITQAVERERTVERESLN